MHPDDDDLRVADLDRRAQEVALEVKVALELGLIGTERQRDANRAGKRILRENAVARIDRADPVARDVIGLPLRRVHAVVELGVIEQPLHLIDVGSAFRVHVELLHDEDVGIDLGIFSASRSRFRITSSFDISTRSPKQSKKKSIRPPPNFTL